MNKTPIPVAVCEGNDEENMFWRAGIDAKLEVRLAEASLRLAEDKKEAIHARWNRLYPPPPPTEAEITQGECTAGFAGALIGFLLTFFAQLFYAFVHKVHLCGDK